jgi:hypothetical protein
MSDYTKQETAQLVIPTPTQRKDVPTMQMVGNQFEVTEFPMLSSAPPKPNEPSEFEKQLPWIIFSILLGLVIQKSFKRGK